MDISGTLMDIYWTPINGTLLCTVRLVRPSLNAITIVYSTGFAAFCLFFQRANFSLRVSVIKAKSLMAKDANGETIIINEE